MTDISGVTTIPPINLGSKRAEKYTKSLAFKCREQLIHDQAFGNIDIYQQGVCGNIYPFEGYLHEKFVVSHELNVEKRAEQ